MAARNVRGGVVPCPANEGGRTAGPGLRDGLPVLPGDGTQSSPAPEFVPATFGQPLAEFLGLVLAAWHDGAHGQDSQLILQRVEEHDRVVQAVHEQHVVLVGDLRVTRRRTTLPADPRRGQWRSLTRNV